MTYNYTSLQVKAVEIILKGITWKKSSSIRLYNNIPVVKAESHIKREFMASDRGFSVDSIVPAGTYRKGEGAKRDCFEPKLDTPVKEYIRPMKIVKIR